LYKDAVMICEKLVYYAQEYCKQKEYLK